MRDLEIEYDDFPIVDWYFNNLSIFVDPLHQMEIRSVEHFVDVYRGKIHKFKNELMPYLQQKIGRKVKLVEMRKLRRICQVKDNCCCKGLFKKHLK